MKKLLKGFNNYSPFGFIITSKDDLLLVCLVGIALTFAFAVIYCKQNIRLQNTTLQKLHVQQENLKVEASKLILELGALQAEVRIEKIAREKLGMITPEKKELIR